METVATRRWQWVPYVARPDTKRWYFKLPRFREIKTGVERNKKR